MPERLVYEVRPHRRGWSVRRRGASRHTAVIGAKADAVIRARALAKKRSGEVLVLGADGRVHDRYTYGSPEVR